MASKTTSVNLMYIFLHCLVVNINISNSLSLDATLLQY